MDIYTVSLFGHRDVDDLWHLEKQLTPILEELIQTKAYVSFLIGRNGEFDVHTASLIKHAQRKYGKENNDMTLVLPYKVANIEDYEKYYDSIIIPDCLYKIHPKSVIGLRNRWMIEQSDFAIFHLTRESGGAYKTMKYAESIGKKFIVIP